MKRLKDLTADELLADDFDVKALIEIECAFQGVVIPIEPEYLPIPKPTPADKTFYECNGQLFKSVKDAETFTNIAYYKNYDSECPEPLINNSYNSSINKKFYYSPDVYANNKGLIKLKETNKNRNSNLKAEYLNILNPYETIETDIHEAIQDIRDERQRESCQIKIFQSYLDLADGNYITAIKFYENAYEETPQYLIDHFDLLKHISEAPF